ncbi:hypothetical protein O181_015602 [Austropuccinia psidii MF-1]|uniref:Uncharacterized protein n=1 Tax=Austropuccinia psidii MF-1 TaxID=1389203 RepID=A0A9Q3GQX0_9BASI|nr:hypothetical protein [Austropuccinia psidii MF-1]
MILILKELMSLIEKKFKLLPPSKKEESNPLNYPQSQFPTRPSTLASTSTNIQPPMASTSRDPMSQEPEKIFDNHQCWDVTGNFTNQKKVNKKVLTSLFIEVDSLTEAFVDKAMKSSIPG